MSFPADPTAQTVCTREQLYTLPDAAFVSHCYQLVLGREADPEGFASAVTALQLGLQTRSGLILQLLESPEGYSRDRLPDWLTAGLTPPSGSFAARLVRRLRALSRLHTLPQILAQLAGRTEAVSQQRMALLNSAIRQLETKTALLDDQLAELQTAQTFHQVRLDRLEPSTEMLCRDIRSALGEYRRQALQDAVPHATTTTAGEAVAGGSEGSCLPAATYASFEELFRGDMATVADDLRLYLPLVREACRKNPGLPTLDLGCGRGEWLDLLTAERLDGSGVELNPLFTEALTARGHTVLQQDVMTALATFAPGSVAAVTGFHLIEHLPPAAWVPLLDGIHRVLAPDGIVLLETPNPRNILVGACDFHRDPGHRNPVFPDTLAFLGRSRGFEDSAYWFFDDGRRQLLPGDSITFSCLDDYIRVSRDYVWSGRKNK